MNLEQVLRVGITAAVWVGVSVLMTLAGIINLFFNVPATISTLFIGAGIAGTFILWNPSTWTKLREAKLLEVEAKITEELQKMNRKDMLEMADGLRQIKEKFGIELDLPLDTKQKHDLDAMLSHLSEEELTELQYRLRSGELSEEDLAQWLQSTHKVRRG
jgi:hypothetical protein